MINLMMNSVINENISDENYSDEVFEYVSRHNQIAQQDIEGTVNNVRGSYIIGSTINSINMKGKLQSAMVLKK